LFGVLFFDWGMVMTPQIAWGKEGATREEVIDAAKKANAHKFIMEFPDGYETKVGGRGMQLSGGQKQRLAISR